MNNKVYHLFLWSMVSMARINYQRVISTYIAAYMLSYIVMHLCLFYPLSAYHEYLLFLGNLLNTFLLLHQIPSSLSFIHLLCTYVYIYICPSIHTHAHTHMYIYICLNMYNILLYNIIYIGAYVLGGACCCVFWGCGFVFQSGAHVLAICYMLELKSVICWFLDSFIALIQHYHLISFCFFMSHWCFTPCQHDSCSILPRNHKSQKNKKPKPTKGKKNEKLRSREDKSRKSQNNFLTKHCCCPFILSNWCHNLCLHNGCSKVPGIPSSRMGKY